MVDPCQTSTSDVENEPSGFLKRDLLNYDNYIISDYRGLFTGYTLGKRDFTVSIDTRCIVCLVTASVSLATD